MRRRRGASAALEAAPAAMEAALSLDEPLAGMVERYRYMEECVVLARGVNQATAMETALKLTETSYVRAHPWSAADFLHGPIAAVDEGYPCILYVSRGRTEAAMLDLARRLFERRAECLLITDSEAAIDLVNEQ